MGARQSRKLQNTDRNPSINVAYFLHISQRGDSQGTDHGHYPFYSSFQKWIKQGRGSGTGQDYQPWHRRQAGFVVVHKVVEFVGKAT